jgi:hypothetical protein
VIQQSVHYNPPDAVEEIFARLEEQVIDISHNMALLMVALENKFRPFGEVGGSNSEVGSNEKLGDSEDPENELKKEHEKEQPSSSAITPSQLLKFCNLVQSFSTRKYNKTHLTIKEAP